MNFYTGYSKVINILTHFKVAELGLLSFACFVFAAFLLSSSASTSDLAGAVFLAGAFVKKALKRVIKDFYGFGLHFELLNHEIKTYEIDFCAMFPL